MGKSADIAAGDPPILLKASEASRLLALSPRKLWELTNRKEIPSVRIGRSLRYDRRDLMAWIEGLKARSGSGR